MTSTQIRAIKPVISDQLETHIAIFEVLQEIAAQLAEHNERENEAQAFTRSGEWKRRQQ